MSAMPCPSCHAVMASRCRHIGQSTLESRQCLGLYSLLPAQPRQSAASPATGLTVGKTEKEHQEADVQCNHQALLTFVLGFEKYHCGSLLSNPSCHCVSHPDCRSFEVTLATLVTASVPATNPA